MNLSLEHGEPQPDSPPQRPLTVLQLKGLTLDVTSSFFSDLNPERPLSAVTTLCSCKVKEAFSIVTS